MRKIQLVLLFYKSYFLPSFLITLSCINLTFIYGLSILNILLWFKIITLGILFYYINNRKKNEFYYYKNLGLTKQILWTLTLLFDILLFVFLMVLTNIFR